MSLEVRVNVDVKGSNFMSDYKLQGRWLRNKRLEHHPNPVEFARLVGYGHDTLKGIEDGKKKPGLVLAARLVEQLLPGESREVVDAYVRWLRGEGPPPPDVAVPPEYLPAPPADFIGRSQNIADTQRYLGKHPMVTLTGVGGVGKTALALKVADRLRGKYKNGIYFIHVGNLSDPKQLPHELMRHVGLIGMQEELGAPMEDTLRERLRDLEILFVLDGCDLMVKACARFASHLLSACRHLHILATCREPLGVSGEKVVNVEPFGLDDSLKLFEKRARMRLELFQLTTDDKHLVEKVCEMLSGLPLAIELTAAHVSEYPLHKFPSLLEDAFYGWTRPISDAQISPDGTMESCIKMSYNLLTESQRILLRRLTVFARGWTLKAAEAVCAEEDKASKEIVVKDLGALVQKSLVKLDGNRYDMLSIIHRWVRIQFNQSDENATIRKRYAIYYRRLAREAEPELRGREQSKWLEQLDVEYENIRGALQWCATSNAQGVMLGLEIGTSIHWWFEMRQRYSDGASILRSLVDRLKAIRSTSDGDVTDLTALTLLVKALAILGKLLWRLGEKPKAMEVLDESLDVAPRVDDIKYAADAYMIRGLIQGVKGGKDLTQALGLYTKAKDDFGITDTLYHLYNTPRNRISYEEAEQHLKEAVDRCRRRGDIWGQAHCLLALADWKVWLWLQSKATMIPAQSTDAAELLREAEEHFRAISEIWGMHNAILLRGTFAFLQGDYDYVAKRLDDALKLFRKVGDRCAIGRYLAIYAEVAWKGGGKGEEIERAKWVARQFGASVHLSSICRGPQPRAQLNHKELEAELQNVLGPDQYNACYNEGASSVANDQLDNALTDLLKPFN